MSALRRRARARVQGTVQGVGFRPYVYRLADELGLVGYVLNDARGVLLEVEGDDEAVQRFLARLEPDAPPLAMIERVDVSESAAVGEARFSIRPSPRGESADAPVAPDSATCGDCLRELLDPADRRHRYPFINCTNCGPRFTIVREIPYDRPYTTMAGFAMCPACRAEYEDPKDRRFHAQPNACPACGPRVSLLDGSGSMMCGSDPLSAAAAALDDGHIVAVKGIGGYHLACRADNEDAVGTLRARKHREDKPFAVMVGSLMDATELVMLSADERDLLCSPARPIVLATRRRGAGLAAAVAPGSTEVGVMLAYSALHHLLLSDVGGPLVMTSGNVSDEPIAFADEDAARRLSAIADWLLVHDRPIQTRTDDSVARVLADGRRMLIRRSRGYVPASLALRQPAEPPILACGAELKNTFCVAKGRRAWVGHHIGDLKNYETLRSFADGIAHFERLFSLTPEVVAHDLHPEYLSTKYALERPGVELVAVQHHHAHLAAVLAEHGESGPAVGVIYDGTGYGSDATVWGGELLVGDLAGFRRTGSLWPVRLPGGDRAIRQPWRMACAWMVESIGPDIPLPVGLGEVVDAASWDAVRRLEASGLQSPVTTSAGRLCDAVAALCGIRPEVAYEGQAAIELEAACDPAERGGYSIALVTADDGRLLIDPRDAIRAIVADVAARVPAGVIASRFHHGLASATVAAGCAACAANGLELVVLGGGVFQNRRLVEAVIAGLQQAGARVLVASQLPVGDGGISYGQAAIAARQIAAGR